MKVISPLVGTVVVRTSNDDTGPINGILPRDYLAFVGNLYEFSVRPQPDTGPTAQFQGGEFVTPSGKIVVQQIIAAADGDAVLAQNTDLADKIMTDYFLQLDKELGYRFGQAKLVRSYASVLVVELDDSFVERVSVFESIGKLVSSAIVQDGPHYKLKRLAFGLDSLPDATALNSISDLVPQDFIIERRAGEPLEKNRFFCRAPLRTTEHIRVLEEIERTALG